MISVMIFGLLINLSTERWSNLIKRRLGVVANLCLGAYLLSYIFDSMFYPILNSRVPDVIFRLEYMPVMVLSVFCCSLGASWVIDLIYRLLRSAAQKVHVHHR